ncbi:hypothetical protein U27_03371 [Candidatus Vecturithrix granuli]|uniref:TPM domain-containing protein n=1 Tax=Vecturithrix granuli TaxID=1499967 RepID=A0A081BVQ4_VECG1|nr:hypothetical protein U27_03371 [Candidatus Vecturithrix granuli]
MQHHYFIDSFKIRRWVPVLWILALLGIVLTGCTPTPLLVTPPMPYLTDEANVLSEAQRTELIDRLEAHNSTQVGRIFVLIIPKLPEEKTLEAYAYEKINATPLASGERNDRILILLPMEERQVRIETSQDVWERLTDEECTAIIQQQFIPQFKTGNYYQGLADGIAAIIAQLEAP